MSIIDKVEAALRRNPEYADRRIAKNVRGSNTAMVNMLRIKMGLAASPPEGEAPKPVRIKTLSKGRTLADFRSGNDVSYIIEEAVKRELPDKGDLYYDDHEFRDLCGLHASNWRRFADDTKFKPWRLVHGKHNLWAPAPMIQQMRRILGI